MGVCVCVLKEHLDPTGSHRGRDPGLPNLHPPRGQRALLGMLAGELARPCNATGSATTAVRVLNGWQSSVGRDDGVGGRWTGEGKGGGPQMGCASFWVLGGTLHWIHHVPPHIPGGRAGCFSGSGFRLPRQDTTDDGEQTMKHPESLRHITRTSSARHVRTRSGGTRPQYHSTQRMLGPRLQRPEAARLGKRRGSTVTALHPGARWRFLYPQALSALPDVLRALHWTVRRPQYSSCM